MEQLLVECPRCHTFRDYRDPSCGKCRKHAKHHRAREHRREIVAYVKAVGCQVCGETRQHELTFHHLDPATKFSDISSLVTQNRTLTVLVKELEKCACVCHTCHSAIHGNRIKPTLWPIRLRAFKIPLPQNAYQATQPV